MKEKVKKEVYKIFICLKEADERYLSLNMIANACKTYPMTVSRLITRYFTSFIEEGHIANLKVRPIRLKDTTLTFEQFIKYVEVMEKINKRG